MASGPLDGIRVLEFSQIIAGPFGCANLADMGADVIKVEPPEGEPWRQFSQFVPGESKWFQTLNRGKRSLVLRLQEPEAQAIIHRLVPEVDVVVINYRPDVAARLAIDYETLSALRDNLIYVDNTAFGRKGPWAAKPGYDIVVQAVSGLMANDGKFDADAGAPEAIGVPLADFATGLVISWAVSAALYHRERTGEGQYIETNLLHTALALQNNLVFDNPAADEMVVAKMAQLHHLQSSGAGYPELLAAHRPYAGLQGANIYYRAYETKDGAVVIGALSPSLWEKVRTALETDFLGIADPNFNPLDEEWMAGARKRVAEVEARVREGTTDEWLARFDANGVPCGPVDFPEDMVDHEQSLANGMIVPLEHDVTGPQRQVAPLVSMSRTPLEAQGSGPPLGRDSDALAALAGYTEEEIAGLRERGIIA